MMKNTRKKYKRRHTRSNMNNIINNKDNIAFEQILKVKAYVLLKLIQRVLLNQIAIEDSEDDRR